jgi:hypothetical protein
MRHNVAMSLGELEPHLVPWLEPPQMDPGSPSPAVRSDAHGLFCAYHTTESASDAGTAVLRFEHVLQYRFGYPNDEALHGHRLFKFGLKHYGFYVVEHSPLIAEIDNQNRVHSAYRPGMYAKFEHWIITFHDETLEVIALHAVIAGHSQLPPDQAVCEA